MITSKELNKLFTASVRFRVVVKDLWHTWYRNSTWDGPEFEPWLAQQGFTKEDIKIITDEINDN